tara:strand:- start:11941 stop:12948 length:1008 start_codon:yes stop_codon:yes gene_type:complete
VLSKLISLNDRIFIAGATGMAGSAICRSLVASGYGDKRNGGCLLIPSHNELDLLDLPSLLEWFEKYRPSVVVIAAAKVGGILANKTYPSDFLLENIKIQTNVIETAWKYGVRRLLFLGSSCMYPKNAIQPIKEEELLTGEIEPTNEWYAIAKLSGLKLCEALRRQHGFDAISLMPTNLYGLGDNYHPKNSHVMGALIRRFTSAVKEKKEFITCWGTGLPTREFLYADDFGDACVFCLENWDPSSLDAPKDVNNELLNHLNVGTGSEISIKDLASMISKITGYSGEILWDASKPDGALRKQLDSRRLISLGWSPKVSFECGLQSAINFFNKIDKNY